MAEGKTEGETGPPELEKELEKSSKRGQTNLSERARPFRALSNVPRRSRVVVPGAPHHVTQRGNNRQPVFLCDTAYQRYLEVLGRHASRAGLRLLGYCLMTNHVHLIVVPGREGSLAQALGRAHAEYAPALNRALGRTGHVWQNRLFSCPMSESHLFSALRYVELNPVQASVGQRLSFAADGC